MRHRHRWDRMIESADPDGQSRVLSYFPGCSCGALRDPAKSKRGTSARRLGHDQERRIERVYGPRKVGEFGDAIDLLGRDWKWQSKATRGSPPLTPNGLYPIPPRAYITRPILAMGHLREDLRPLLIRSWVRHGLPTVDIVIVYWADWWNLHRELIEDPPQFVAMSGAHFLDVHGRDEPKEEAI